MPKYMPKYTVEIGSGVYINGKRYEETQRISGNCRFVCPFGRDLIFKADVSHHKRDCYIQTKREIDKYLNHITPYDKRYFPKLVAWGTYKQGRRTWYWLIEERIKIAKLQPNERHRKVIKRIKKQYKLWDLDEYYPCNWAITKDNKVCIYDFAL